VFGAQDVVVPIGMPKCGRFGCDGVKVQRVVLCFVSFC
jgi:hypothetical protein